ncbi:MAG TPA: ADP-glyceromanno-heptose 6-epimerase [Caulobacteraceae bacterium]
MSSRKTIVVTGGAGFIGSNIVADLTARGDVDVVVCDRLRAAESGKWRNLSKHPITDFWAPEALFAGLEDLGDRLEAVIHMGAVSSTTEPDADHIIHSNFSLSRDLWRWACERDKRLIWASSAATYGDGSTGFDDEDDLASLTALRPLNAYGWSKALFDAHARREAHRGCSPAQWVGLKFFNVYGPNEGHKATMKSVVAQIWPTVESGGIVSLFKSHHPDYPDGGQLRDFVYVRDVSKVVLWLLDHPRISGIFNLGTGEARAFADLAKATFAAAGREPSIAYREMPEVLRGRYQYFTQARMDRLRRAGYAEPFATREEGVGDYVRGYLSRPDPYR